MHKCRGNGFNVRNKNRKHFIDYINRAEHGKAEHAEIDVLGLQEICWEDARVISQNTELKYVSFRDNYSSVFYEGNGNAVLSRYPFRHTEKSGFGFSAVPFMGFLSSLDIHFRNLLHYHGSVSNYIKKNAEYLLSHFGESFIAIFGFRKYIRADIELPDGKIVAAYFTHFHSFNYQRRNKQAKKLAKRVNRHYCSLIKKGETPRIIVGGDLNTVRENSQLCGFKHGDPDIYTKDKVFKYFRKHMPWLDIGARWSAYYCSTYPVGKSLEPERELDYLFSSMKTKHHCIVKLENHFSDHLMVVKEFDLLKQAADPQ